MIDERIAHRFGVVFRKQVSDGNYGTEAVEISLESDVDESLDLDYQVEALAMQARRLVHAELERSPNARVRQALLPGGRQAPERESVVTNLARKGLLPEIDGKDF